MRLPPPLPRDRPITIRIVAPSGILAPHAQRLNDGIKILELHGCIVRIDRSLSSRNYRGYLCGDDVSREMGLVEAITEPGVDIVWWARGGSGAGRLQKSLLEQIEGAEPRWLIGFSDATSLLNAISIELGWVTVHGPTVTLLPTKSVFIEELRALMDPSSVLFGSLNIPMVPVYGGNITVLASMMGTVQLDHLEKHILLFEDVGEAPYRLDRSLTQIRHVWPVKLIEEIWLGDLDLDPEATHQIADFIENDFECRVRRGVPAGHRGEMGFIPLGYGAESS